MMKRDRALATDYDGTLASSGRVSPRTLEAIARYRATGRKTLLVTGRVLDDLATIFDEFELFDRIIAENGAVLHAPATGVTLTLAKPPPEALLHTLRARGVAHLHRGRVILATREPYDRQALEAIGELGLDLRVIYNKGAVMLLPAHINKGTGVVEAAHDLDVPLTSIVGVGDAENDRELLGVCGYAVAVANALPELKQHAAWVTPHEDGRGVVDLIERLLGERFQGNTED